MELLVKMDIVYEDKDKIILNMPVAGDGKYGGNMAVQAAERIKGIRIKRGCIALCAVSLKVDGSSWLIKGNKKKGKAQSRRYQRQSTRINCDFTRLVL